MTALLGAHKISHSGCQAEETISFEREANNEIFKISVHGPLCDFTACTCDSECVYFRTRQEQLHKPKRYQTMPINGDLVTRIFH
jgi:hypothetical protein